MAIEVSWLPSPYIRTLMDEAQKEYIKDLTQNLEDMIAITESFKRRKVRISEMSSNLPPGVTDATIEEFFSDDPNFDKVIDWLYDQPLNSEDVITAIQTYAQKCSIKLDPAPERFDDFELDC